MLMQIVKNDPRQLTQAEAGQLLRDANHLVLLGRTDKHIEQLNFFLKGIPEALWAMTTRMEQNGFQVCAVMAVFIPRTCQDYADLIADAGQPRRARGEEQLIMFRCDPGDEPGCYGSRLDPESEVIYGIALNLFEHAVDCHGAHPHV